MGDIVGDMVAVGLEVGILDGFELLSGNKVGNTVGRYEGALQTKELEGVLVG